MMVMRPKSIRFRVNPGDVPAEMAARRLHLTLAEFQEKLPRLINRGVPAADPDTAMFDLEAIDEWRRARNPQLFGLTTAEKPRDPREVFDERLARLGRR
jgi:hypothetical protein